MSVTALRRINTYDEYEQRTQQMSIYGKNTADFDLVQHLDTSTMYTCMVYLDLCIKGFLFVNVLDRSVGVWAEP